MPLIIPNTIANGQLADGDKLQQNWLTVQDYINQDVIRRDGQVAMQQPLLLAGNPTENGHAANKAYVDSGTNALAARVAALEALNIGNRLNSLEARMNAVEAKNGEQDGRLAAHDNANAAQQGQINNLRARSDYEQRKTSNWRMWGNKSSPVFFNGNGDFTCDFGNQGCSSVSVVAWMADPAIGGFLTLRDAWINGFSGHGYAHDGGPLVGTFPIAYVAAGLFDEGYPPL